MTKKDAGFPFHFHVLNLFKSWSNLGFDQKIQMGIKFQEKIKRMKKQRTLHSYVIYIVSIQVDKQGLDIFKLENHVYIYP